MLITLSELENRITNKEVKTHVPKIKVFNLGGTIQEGLQTF